eukprot:Seg685.10 transcript_id=Seg685.10/GoldUCD/mRNA.D3Y31 product="Protein phosphatase PTC7" protein_id=Seg685.10/GoldUCD/D3Y31
MAMQSGIVYGRLIIGQAKDILIRNLVTKSPSAQSFRLVTAYCGFAKLSSSRPRRKFIYGEDAFFIAENKFSNVLGVADGVGGWRDYGIDPAKFSTSLMRKCERFVVDGGLARAPTAVRVIKEGYQDLSEDKPANFGSSTACVIVFDKQKNILNSANLGDSGFLIFRKGKVLYRSSEQQHYFNTPYQLASPPPDQEGTVIQDSIDEADQSTIPLEEDDVIVLGSDGLFDNLSTQQIGREILQLKDTSKESLQYLANCLAGKARKLAYDPNYLSPFAVNARKAGIEIRGGKPDDITVLISLVSSRQDN